MAQLATLGRQLKQNHIERNIMKLLFTVLSVGIGFFGTIALGNAQGVLTFDSLPSGDYRGGPGYAAVPNGYGGLNWNNFGVVNGAEMSPSNGYASVLGYYSGVVSPNNVAFNEYGDPASITVSGGLFDLDSAYLTSAIDSVPLLDIQVQGFVGATMLYNNTYTVNNSGSTLINFDYSGIDSVTFTSGEEQFAMDNLTVFVPEPKSLNLILLIIPFAVMNLLRRRPNKSPEPTAVGAVSSAVAVHAASRRWLSFFR